MTISAQKISERMPSTDRRASPRLPAPTAASTASRNA